MLWRSESRAMSPGAPAFRRLVRSLRAAVRQKNERKPTVNNLDYGIIGNCRSAALVAKTGSIDWCCLPEFNSPSIFARILDEERGGCFAIDVGPDYRISQYYVYRTNILCTRFANRNDVFEVLDFMPRYRADNGHYHCPPEIIRMVRPVSGRPQARFRYQPRLGYAEGETVNTRNDHYIKSTTSGGGSYESVYLYTDLDHDILLSGGPVTIDRDFFFLISYNQKLVELDRHKVRLEYERTEVYWLNWLERTIHFTRYQTPILRSALVLKLLTFHKSGAILAAVTTSLPEVVGDVRNWDYRFCWIRDASMVISILTALGHYNSAQRFLDFIVSVIPFKEDKIQIMYGIRGEKELTERELHWLSGYGGSRPVRVGNAAYQQKQNDIYGVLIDVIYQYFSLFRHTLTHSEDLWTIVRSLMRTVAESWRHPDKGIWEIRSGERHFTFSKVLSWVAMDRGTKIATLLDKPEYALEWSRTAEEIRQDIHEKGWNERVQAFTQYYGAESLDAANLLMETYGFLEAHDPRFVSTVLRTKEQLCRDGLMYRYRNEDDFGPPRSSFTVCTFWLVKCLYKIGQKEEAERMFHQTLTYANNLGLFSEGIDFETKRLVGNFPQGYSHLALIDAAMTLSGMQVTEEQKMISLLRYPFSD
jgi:GH15 family glucan-1,4-alpha-glucosidase